MASAKTVLAAYEKAGIDSTLLCYQVIAGAPLETYHFFSPMESLALMDKAPKRQKAYREAVGMQNLQNPMCGMGDIFVSLAANLFSVRPKISYVSSKTPDDKK